MDLGRSTFIDDLGIDTTPLPMYFVRLICM